MKMAVIEAVEERTVCVLNTTLVDRVSG